MQDVLIEAAKLLHYQDTLVLIALVAVGWFVFPRKKAFLQSAAMAYIFSYALQLYFKIPRPCVSAPALVPCPEQFGFPSIHATLAAVLFIGSVGSEWFWLFAPAALFTAYSRVMLGVHSTEQVAAGFALGSVVYLLNWLHVKRT